MTRIKPKTIYTCDWCQKSVDVEDSKELFGWSILHAMRDELVPRDKKWRRDFCSIECLVSWCEKETKQQVGDAESGPHPCPWCGCCDVEFHLVMGCPSGRQAVCKSCHAAGPVVQDIRIYTVADADVIAAWNNRK